MKNLAHGILFICIAAVSFTACNNFVEEKSDNSDPRQVVVQTIPSRNIYVHHAKDTMTDNTKQADHKLSGDLLIADYECKGCQSEEVLQHRYNVLLKTDSGSQARKVLLHRIFFVDYSNKEHETTKWSGEEVEVTLTVESHDQERWSFYQELIKRPGFHKEVLAIAQKRNEVPFLRAAIAADQEASRFLDGLVQESTITRLQTENQIVQGEIQALEEQAARKKEASK